MIFGVGYHISRRKLNIRVAVIDSAMVNKLRISKFTFTIKSRGKCDSPFIIECDKIYLRFSLL